MNEFLVDLRGNKTKKEVAAALGISPQGLGMIERGERFPRQGLMKKIADYYSLTVDEIFFNKKCNKTLQNPNPAA